MKKLILNTTYRKSVGSDVEDHDGIAAGEAEAVRKGTTNRIAPIVAGSTVFPPVVVTPS
jgi:hypothetical protein